MRTTSRPAAFVLVLAVLLAACGSGLPSGAVATVNGAEIPRELVERIVVAQMEGPSVPPGQDERDAAQDEIQRNVLTTLIGVEIVTQLAVEQGIEPTDEQLDAELEEQRSFLGDQEQFEGFLETIGLSEQEYRDLIVADAVRREQLASAFGGDVTDADVEAAFEERRTTYADARHILLDTEDEAEEVLALLDDGEDFAELARERSTDEGSGAEGGDLGYGPNERYVPPFRDALSEMSPGEIRGPVESDFGFHVIERLEDPDFAEVEDQLRAELEQAAATSPELVAAFEDAFTEAEVRLDGAYGTWDAEQGRVVPSEGVGEAPTSDPSDAPVQGPGDELTEEQLQELLEEQLGDAGDS